MANYGGGVFFVNHDLYFYTAQDRIEARARFRGNLEPDILGADTAAVISLFGDPVSRTPAFSGDGVWYYPRSYGCLTLGFSRRLLKRSRFTLAVQGCGK